MANKRTKAQAKRLGIRVTTGTKRRTEKTEKVLSAQVKKKQAQKRKLANMPKATLTRGAKALGMRGGNAKAKRMKALKRRKKK